MNKFFYPQISPMTQIFLPNLSVKLCASSVHLGVTVLPQKRGQS